MQLKSRRRKLVITALDREGLDALMSGEYQRVCELCGALYDDLDREFLAALVTECLAEEHIDEGGIMWNTLWIGVSQEDGEFVGAVRILGRPSEGRELSMALYPAVGYNSPTFAYVFSRVCEWAFNHRTVYYIRVASMNEDEETFLRSFGFVQNREDGFFEREKNQSAWLIICLCIGLGTGVAMGEAFGGTSLGMAIGATFGAAVGWNLDHRDVSRRKKI